MKKGQAVKFWKELSNSTGAKEVISAFANKRGYGGERTLMRYSQVAVAFKQGLSSEAIAEKTGWRTDYIGKIRAWWKEAFPSNEEQQTQTKGDIELGPHQRGLFYFGQLLRDKLSFHLPHTVIEYDLTGYPKAMWNRRYSKRDRPRDMEEESVHNEWHFGEVDARQLPLFPFFKQHLERHSCWSLLDVVEKEYGAYLSFTSQAYQAIKQRLTSELSNENNHDIESLAMVLLFHGFYRALGTKSTFDFDRIFLAPTDKRGWSMQIGRWKVGNKDTLEALQPIAKLLLTLSTEIPSLPLILNLGRVHTETDKAIEDFRQSLTPDDRLRKLIIIGHCDLCLYTYDDSKK